MPARTNHRHSTEDDLQRFFESRGGEGLLAGGLKEMCFGEYLVEQAAINRFQLFRALQMQDRNPGVRLGECVAALGYLPYPTLERLLVQWNRLGVVET